MPVGSEALPKEEVSFATRQSFSLAQRATLNLLLCFRLRAPQVSIILKPIVSALAYIHSLGIIHRDVRAESILISSKGNIKLSSFSLATQVRRELVITNSKACPLVLNACNFVSFFCPKLTKDMPVCKTRVGYLSWLAPEVLSGRGYTTACDIWAVAATVIELADGKPFLYGLPESMVLLYISRSIPPFSTFGMFVSLVMITLASNRPLS